jgi:hypothetical protein
MTKGRLGIRVYLVGMKTREFRRLRRIDVNSGGTRG